MGLFNVFKKKVEEVSGENVKGIYAPITGNLIPLSEVPDPVFSQKLMGDGFAIDPTDGKVYSPVAGKVVSIFPTKHAIALLSDEGYEILIHFGMDTVNLKGEGFTTEVEEGQVVSPGDLLLTVDIETIRLKVPSLLTPVIFTNLSDRSLELKKTGSLVHGETDIVEIT